MGDDPSFLLCQCNSAAHARLTCASFFEDGCCRGLRFVSLPDEPTSTIHQCPTPVTEGDIATLYCNATGNPAPSMAWIRASTRKVVSNNERLVIAAIKRSELGSYECLAWNGFGNNDTKSCSIDVHCKQTFLFLIIVQGWLHQRIIIFERKNSIILLIVNRYKKILSC